MSVARTSGHRGLTSRRGELDIPRYPRFSRVRGRRGSFSPEAALRLSWL